MRQINYAIIENENLAFESLKKIVSSLRSNYNLVFWAESVEDTVAFFKSAEAENVDLIFMDIELVDGNCFDIFKQVKIDIPIIFTTAYDNFAIKAFEVNSVGYILKPVSEQKTCDAIMKYEKQNLVPLKNIGKYVPDNNNADSKKYNKRFLVSIGDDFSYVDVDNIACFLYEDKYVVIYTKNGEKHISTINNLMQIEESIDKTQFFRISRMCVTNIANISRVKRHAHGRLSIKLNIPISMDEIIVSSAKRDDFLNWLGGVC